MNVDSFAHTYDWLLGNTGVNYTGWNIQLQSSGSKLNFLVGNGSSWDINTVSSGTGYAISTGTWYHVAVVKNGTAWTMYVDGTSRATGTSAATDYNNTLQIGASTLWSSEPRDFDGYMDEIRISDSARYTTTFTPSTTAFTADANTKLLIHSDFNGGLGQDSSGNKNDFTVTNLLVTDQMIDTPTNNYCTLNPLAPPRASGSFTYSEGNLKVSMGGIGDADCASTMGASSGKWYAEAYIVTGDQTTNTPFVGVVSSKFLDSETIASSSSSLVYYYTGNKRLNGTVTSYGATYNAGDIIGVAFNSDSNEVTFYKNNATQGAVSITADEYVFNSGRTAGTPVVVWNFGQDSSFAGATTAQGNGGTGEDFYYTPPTGFVALNTDNLPDPAIALPTDHFNTLLYTANNSTLSVTGAGFQPDFIWFKNRTNANRHALFDSVRGATKRLASNGTYAEVADADTLTSFDSDGWTIGADTGQYGVNYPTASSFTSWNWKAGGTAVSNTDGTIPSSVSANTTNGFSIITYTGDGVSGKTIGHGLSQAPDMTISFNRDGGNPWVWHKDLNGGAFDTYIQLNAIGAYLSTPSSGYFTAMSASTLTMTAGTSTIYNLNRSAYDYLLYAFHSIEGYSKVGSYETNNTADNAFVYTGFKPAWVMVKNMDSGGNYCTWTIIDNKRDTYNPADLYLTANGACQENYSSNTSGTCVSRGDIDIADFLSNGFKIRSSSGEAGGGPNTYIYYAIAESPFKTSNAR